MVTSTSLLVYSALWLQQHVLSRVLEIIKPLCQTLRPILIEGLLVHSSPSDQINDQWSSISLELKPHCDVSALSHWWGNSCSTLLTKRKSCGIVVVLLPAGVPTYTTQSYLVSPQDPAVYGMSLTGIWSFLWRIVSMCKAAFDFSVSFLVFVLSSVVLHHMWRLKCQ